MRFRTILPGALVTAAAVGLLIVWAVQPQPVQLAQRQTFDNSSEEWFAYGSGASVRMTRDRANVKAGAGALELEYTIAPNQAGSAVLLVADGALADVGRLRFWIKTDDDTVAAVVLSEKRPDGGDYSAWFWSPKQQWQLIELRLDDFAVNEGPGDATDKNGRLDPAQIQAVGFIELGQFFGSFSSDPKFPLFLKASGGTHYLHVDEFEVVRDGAQVSTARASQIGDPARGFSSWITLGGATLSLTKPGHPLESAAFEATYEQRPGKYPALAHGLANLDLNGVTALSFTVASAGRATIMAYLEERNPGHDAGPRYALTFEVRGGAVPSQTVLPLTEFTYDAMSPQDPDGRLTAGRLRAISLIDITGATLSVPRQNTLWFSPVSALAH